jgi:hypothetical protein
VAAGRADVADVQQPRLAQALLDVQAEELGVGRFEVAADRVDGDYVAARGLTLGGSEDRRCLVERPDGRCSRRVENDGLVGLAAGWVVVDAACAPVGDADIAKVGLAGGLVKVDAEVGADDRAFQRLVGETDTRRESSLLLL